MDRISQGRDSKSYGLSPSPRDKCGNVQLFLVAFVGNHKFEAPIYIGNKRQERLTALLNFVGSAGVPIEEAMKFLMGPPFYAPRGLVRQDFRDLEYIGRLRKDGDWLFAVEEAETR